MSLSHLISISYLPFRFLYNRMGYWSDWSIPILVTTAAGFTYITVLLVSTTPFAEGLCICFLKKGTSFLPYLQLEQFFFRKGFLSPLSLSLQLPKIKWKMCGLWPQLIKCKVRHPGTALSHVGFPGAVHPWTRPSNSMPLGGRSLFIPIPSI